MKRNKHIAHLSRDHHTGLLFCWKIRQGLRLQAPASRMAPYVDYFYTKHLLPHFREEEEILFRLLPGDTLCGEAIRQHTELAKLAGLITSNEQPEENDLRQLADMLDEHIRFEERKLFPHIEQGLTDAQLEKAGNELAPLHQAKNNDDYPDEFWVRQQ
ncbi:MAG TPA: hemerythrin domain-containing protein [Chitinophagaceae bacterium]|nr:hemerythrin domain-containing protein [Chitinophagaceae bacterium]